MSEFSRRSFLTRSALGAGFMALGSNLTAQQQDNKPTIIQGFDQTDTDIDASQEWKPFSDRKIKMGIVGFGVCQFGAAFELQNHPNVEVVAVSDLFPDRCAGLAKACKCEKTYPSLEEMIKDDSIEAIFVATDAPSHPDHCMKVLNSGKHVATAVPAVFGDLEAADKLYETVKKTGLLYAMFETSSFHDQVFAARKLYKAGAFGKMMYTEGEYFHYSPEGNPIPSYKDWRIGVPPQWYPTHSNAYYTCVTGNSFIEVSCMGIKSIQKDFTPEGNRYKNPFATEIALFRTSEGGMARMGVSWDSGGISGEMGRNRGQYAGYYNEFMPLNEEVKKIAENMNLRKPALPPGVGAGGHGGSHGYLGNDFVDAILRNRLPLVNIAVALNTTVSGVVAHQSALKDGEILKIPQYTI
ncbi:MAG: Gfo/Idh/MocA family oxidoreductase [Planctomycetia bacterium]|nr:Gfo/Idh/MocA family oxidoreductase [Planctomycetia bacterium]